jgi:iron complex outermembrane receptor protein
VEAAGGAAGARIYGAEFEGDWNITSVDHLKGFATYLEATYTTFNGAIDIRDNATIGSLAGSHLPFAPDVTLRGQYSHDLTLSNGGMLSPMVAVYWQSESYTQSCNIPVFGIMPYSKTYMPLIDTDPTAHWNVSAYVDNLEDKAVRTGDFASQNIVYTEYGAPRTYGMKVSVRY